MSVLSACSSAMVRIVGRKPTTVFSSTDQMEMELADLANETAVAIAKEHDWRALTSLATFTGDAVATGFALPTDYDRMLVKGDVHSTRWQFYRFFPVRDLDQWLDAQVYLRVGAPGVWTILGNEFKIQPAMATGEVATFYYVSKNLAIGADTTHKPAFTTDSDTFALDERLLTLGLIWRWRAQKRLEYAEDMANYEIALAEAIGRDKGRRPFAISSRRKSLDTRYAYPGRVGQ